MKALQAAWDQIMAPSTAAAATLRHGDAPEVTEPPHRMPDGDELAQPSGIYG